MGEQELYDEMGAENKLGNIGVAEASLIFRKLSMTAFEGGNKYMVIWLAERMNQEASNQTAQVAGRAAKRYLSLSYKPVRGSHSPHHPVKMPHNKAFPNRPAPSLGKTYD